MKSKFALSFGIALIFIGGINFFLDTNNVILFGISLSAFVFSLISILFSTKIYEEKYEFLYIIPLVVMLSFLCYGTELMKIDFINRIINSNEFYGLKKEKVTTDDLSIYNDRDKKAIYLYYLMNNGFSKQEKIINIKGIN